MLEIAKTDPFALYDEWLAEAEAAETFNATAAALATVSAGGMPSVRMVLLRGRDDGAVYFYTNYNSRKAADMEATGKAALCLYWKSLGRQIRLEGRVARADAVRSDAYFASRPYGSQIAAMASRQSEPVASRAALDAAFAEMLAAYPEGGDVPRPANWGGYGLTPDLFEFWQQGDDRLHDRFRFTKDDEGWKPERLYP